MKGELYDSTIPFGEPELLKASAYERYLDELDTDTAPGRAAHRLSQFSPSLQADLWQHEQRSGSYEVTEVIAACIRHSSRVTIYLRCDGRVVPLTLFPRERLVHCPIAMSELLDRHLAQLHVMHLEPATLRPPGDPARELIGEARLHHPLTPLLWAIALHGPRRELLPEIAGPAVYRVSPALELAGAPLSGALRAAIERLREQAVSLAALAGWPAFDRERAARLLNALYLQAGLIVSRSHPDAVRESWFGL
ncbi:MAG TPA: hypothetical protein VNU71_18220 [Burkholderiaceae bacterium]|nr:hypothetical protein [Burkholderiaceae bacterium]